MLEDCSRWWLKLIHQIRLVVTGSLELRDAFWMKERSKIFSMRIKTQQAAGIQGSWICFKKCALNSPHKVLLKMNMGSKTMKILNLCKSSVTYQWTGTRQKVMSGLPLIACKLCAILEMALDNYTMWLMWKYRCILNIILKDLSSVLPYKKF